jgi:hypothetical protein
VLSALLLTLAVLAPATMAQDGETIVVTDDITSNTTWESENTYVLNGLVFVGPPTVNVDSDGNITGTKNLGDDSDDPTLTIEPGTVIKARASEDVTAVGNNQEEGASALIVRRSGRINAQGTPDAPVTFTAQADDIDNPFDMNEGDGPGRRFWGGVIILGEASTNQTAEDGSARVYNTQIEGIPVTNNEAAFGGGTANNVNDEDNSGYFRYASIRHAGFSISGVEGDEINGLTMGALGRGTTIDHVEVYANFDDGFEWFGGTVHTSHLLAAYCGDDAFDYDQGFRGTGQYWLAVQDNDRAGRGGEHDGNDLGAFSDAPFTSRPVITNATYIGAGKNATNVGGDGSNNALQIRDQAGGEYYNSIFTDFPETAVSINTGDGTIDRVGAGDLFFENNAFYGFGAGSTFSDLVNTETSSFDGGFTDSDVSNPIGNLSGSGVAVRGTDRDQETAPPLDNLDPRPTQSFTDAAPDTRSPSGFVVNAALDIDGVDRSEYLSQFESVGYHGAVDPSRTLASTWAAGWSFTFAEEDDPQGETIVVTDDITSNTTWKSENTYVLNGLVFVGPPTVNVDSDGNITGTKNLGDDSDDPTLTIEPGTVIKARASEDVTAVGNNQEEGASALIVRRSGRINAQGTPDAPVTFTAQADDIDNPFDMNEGDGPGRRFWGGVIILGEASTNQTAEDGSARVYNTQIEGIPVTNNEAAFGGGTANNVNDEDNSGYFRYASIRHAGFSISGVEGDEINGLTMGALGRGTTIDHVEVYANFDDGFEWFGGTVHTSHLLAAYCGDDAFDYDQGFRGTGQYWLAVQDNDRAGRGGEHDGNDLGAFSDAPFTSRPVITNATYIGAGKNATNVGGDGSNNALQIRDQAGGEYYNSIFTDFPETAVSINTGDGTIDRVGAGDLFFENNAFYGFGAGSTFSDLVNTETSSFENGFSAAGLSNPIGNLAGSDIAVRSVDRNQQDGEKNLDPRPTQSFMNAAPDTRSPSGFVANGASDIDGVSDDEYVSVFDDVSYHGAVAPNVNPFDTWPVGWTAAFTNQLYLPVEMAGFKVQRDGESFILSWATASETNNAGFDVQRSVNGEPFTTIGIRQGAGTTEQGRSYQFTDANVPFEASTLQYRLRQRDLDGSTELGPTRTVDLGDPTEAALRSPFPNPTTGQATVQYKLAEDGPVSLSVYNVLGQRVATLVDGEQSAGRKQHTLDTSSFSSGVYFLRLNTNGKVVTERMTVMR